MARFTQPQRAMTLTALMIFLRSWGVGTSITPPHHHHPSEAPPEPPELPNPHHHKLRPVRANVACQLVL
eukprot:760269-Hanusia_phi.AAC.1